MGGSSGRQDLDVELLAVRWVRDELPSEDLPALAANAMVTGCDSPSLRLLAGVVGRPTSAEVQGLAERCLHEFGIELPTLEETSSWLVNHWLKLIRKGVTTPYRGAAEIASLSGEWWNQPCWIQLRPFIGLASEWDDHPDHRDEFDQAIRDEAAKLLATGGFKPDKSGL